MNKDKISRNEKLIEWKRKIRPYWNKYISPNTDIILLVTTIISALIAYPLYFLFFS